MIKELDTVIAKRKLTEKVFAGTKGAVVMVHNSKELAYEVEFVDEQGYTIDVLTVHPNDIENFFTEDYEQKYSRCKIMELDSKHWSRASLRILSEKRSVEYISEKMDMQPTRCGIKGERFSKRNPTSAIRDYNGWYLESNVDTQEPLDVHIKYILAVLKGKFDVIEELHEDCL